VYKRQDILGEYDTYTYTYYITTSGFRTIAKELGIEEEQLIDSFIKAGVMEKEKITYYSKTMKNKVRVYKIKFSKDISSD